MSLEQHAFIKKEKVPSRDAWQAAIDLPGFNFQLDPSLHPNESSGFLPCKLDGIDTGFEIYHESLSEYLESYPSIAEKVSGLDWAISFRWQGDPSECICVLLASAALCDTSEAVVY